MSVILRTSLPRFVQQGRAETLVPLLYNETGTRVGAASGTYTLKDATGEAVIDAAPVELNGAYPYYGLLATFADDYSLPQDTWRETWALAGITAEAASAQTFEQEVHVCRVAPSMHCSLDDLFDLHSAWPKQVPRARANYGTFLTAAWSELIARLLGDGHLPHRVLNWHALSIAHKYRAAVLICRDFATDAPDASRWAKLADTYWARANEEYEQQVKLQRDDDEDGVADNPGQLAPIKPGPPAASWRWGQS